EDAPFTIHVGLCPNDQVPADFFATCHGNPGANIEFFKDTTSLGSSNAAGVLNATFSGSGTAQINGGVPGEFARNFIYCSSDADQSTLVTLTEVEAGTSASVPYSPSGTTCDWYVVPFNLSGMTPTPGTNGGVTKLPNTGTGMALESGSTGPGTTTLALLGFAVLAMAGLCLRVRRLN
ncbi:MAG TPA: hypothetical protein PK819_06615, partial [Thermomicrobiales bacterium]|nr:hypothetical protein [Thermomicrobiales bacterium]